MSGIILWITFMNLTVNPWWLHCLVHVGETREPWGITFPKSSLVSLSNGGLALRAGPLHQSQQDQRSLGKCGSCRVFQSFWNWCGGSILRAAELPGSAGFHLIEPWQLCAEHRNPSHWDQAAGLHGLYWIEQQRLCTFSMTIKASFQHSNHFSHALSCFLQFGIAFKM